MKSLNKGTAKAKIKAPEIPVNKPLDSREEQPDGILSTLKMDMRTSTAKQLVAIREAITRNPAETASGLVRDLLAVNALLMREIVKEVAASDVRVVDDAGEIHPLIGKTWFQLQAGIVQSAKAIIQLETAAKHGTATARPTGETGPMDISAVILEASSHD